MVDLLKHMETTDLCHPDGGETPDAPGTDACITPISVDHETHFSTFGFVRLCLTVRAGTLRMSPT